ncbi:hypothetical protein ANCCAN_15726, partial [Ancylostoma caninum]
METTQSDCSPPFASTGTEFFFQQVRLFSVTMATVGYGDAKPVTAFGKLVATATSICGIIVLAFPISMIVEKFATAQQKAIEAEQFNQGSS